MPVTDPAALHREAQRLAEIWSGVSSVHLAAGQGCACSVGGVLLSAADFELDIVEFVLFDAQKAGAAAVTRFIEATARRGPEAYSLSALLEAMTKTDADPSLDAEGLEFILFRLSKSLGSLESTHRDTRPPPVIGRRF